MNDRLKFKNIEKRLSDDIKNRIISILHGVLTAVFTAYHLIADSPKIGGANINYQHFIIISSASYFLYDFIACYYYHLCDI